MKLTTKDSAVGGVKQRTIWVRELLRDLVLFLAIAFFKKIETKKVGI